MSTAAWDECTESLRGDNDIEHVLIDEVMKFLCGTRYEAVAAGVIVAKHEQEHAVMAKQKLKLMPLFYARHFVLVAFRHPTAKAAPDVVKCYNSLETWKPREYATAKEALATFIKSRWTRIRTVLFDCECPQQKGADCGCETLRNAAVLVNHPEKDWSRAKLRAFAERRREVFLGPRR